MEIRILIILLAFIVTIAALGTFLYVYFRHQQNKVISQEQSDEARNKYFERRNGRFSTPITWSQVVSRFLLFYSAFIVFFLFSARITNGADILEIISLVLLVVVASPLILVFSQAG